MKRILTIALLSLFLTDSISKADFNPYDFDPAFAHTVFFWFKEPDNAEHRKTFEVALKQFLKDSKYAKTGFIGTPPKAVRDVVDDTFTYSLIVSFESAEAQESYQTEPAHDVFVDACKEMWAKVIVYDSVPIK